MSLDPALQQAMAAATSRRIEQLADNAMRELKKLKKQQDTVIKEIEQHQ